MFTKHISLEVTLSNQYPSNRIALSSDSRPCVLFGSNRTLQEGVSVEETLVAVAHTASVTAKEDNLLNGTKSKVAS